ncbi:hypothetical protein EG835_13040 [bacterium]|nr:hypothetical protein [bacterium]
MLPHRVLVATGAKFPDALAGAALAARLRAPVLLTRRDVLPVPSAGYLEDRASSLTRSIIIGNTAAVGEDVEKQIEKR